LTRTVVEIELEAVRRFEFKHKVQRLELQEHQKLLLCCLEWKARSHKLFLGKIRSSCDCCSDWFFFGSYLLPCWLELSNCWIFGSYV